MRYLLDANIVIALHNEPRSLIARRVRRHESHDIGVSAIVLHELYYGSFKSHRADHNVRVIDALPFEALEFSRDDARHAGEIRAILTNRGTPIGPYDVLIAGQARARQLTLVTRNTAEFARVPYLRIEDWSRGKSD
jgi:tRNA(fMet)-specific endonuclease VapC